MIERYGLAATSQDSLLENVLVCLLCTPLGGEILAIM